MSGFVCVDRIVVSSAYVTVVMFGDVGVGTSAVYMLKSVGESTPPCGTPVFVFLSVDLYSCCKVYTVCVPCCNLLCI